MPNGTDRAEIECSFNAALSRRGVAGRIVLRGSTAELRGGAEVVAVDLGDWVDQWPLLPPEIQARKVHAALERLVGATHGRPRGDSRLRGAWRDRLRSVVVALLVVGLVGAGLHWLRAANFFGPAGDDHDRDPNRAATAAPSPAAADPTRQAAAVCEAARARVLGGGTLAGFDVAGWEAVAWLARVDGTQQWQRGIEQRLRAGEFADLARQLLRSPQPGAVALARPRDRSGMAAAQVATGLRLSGDFVSAFFDPQRRPDLLTFSYRLVADHDAQLAGLYAQCAHLDTHDVGGWYYGRQDAQAIAALVFLSAVGTDPRSAGAKRFGTPDDGLMQLVGAATAVTPVSLERVVAHHGGTVSRITSAASAAAPTEPSPPVGTHISFPTGALTHATAAARSLLKVIAGEPPRP